MTRGLPKSALTYVCHTPFAGSAGYAKGGLPVPTGQVWDWQTPPTHFTPPSWQSWHTPQGASS